MSLAPLIPAGLPKIAESGVTSAAQVEAFARAGAAGVLVGEALVTAGQPAETVAEFTSAGGAAR